tara:strand:+ start:98 stop:301 length:204 start_codon:yes stop_codon:yes gene_type:complete
MPLLINDVVEKITEGIFSGERFVITSFKSISGNIHVTIQNVNDDSSVFTLALSAIADKSRFRVVKKL